MIEQGAFTRLFHKDEPTTDDDVMLLVDRALPLSEKEWVEAEHEELQRRKTIYQREALAVKQALYRGPNCGLTEKQALIDHLDAVYRGLFEPFVQGREAKWPMVLPEAMFSPHPLRGK